MYMRLQIHQKAFKLRQTVKFIPLYLVEGQGKNNHFPKELARV